MATISARVDDKVKAEAETVADMIGIPLSTAITVFLKRFAADKGFPFEVTAKRQMIGAYQFEIESLNQSVKRAIADKEDREPSPFFSYVDPNTGEICRKYVSNDP